MGSKVQAIIHFLDGSRMRVEWQVRETDPTQLARRIREGLERDTIAFDVDDSLFVIPRSSIKYFQITPAPQALPDVIIKGVGFVE